ncbi:MAG: hypothetical protein IPK13_25010 [Deltaproteobacteria bacterium]|nr:hypothetical protein [Deltaproteobacteria bacterium]
MISPLHRLTHTPFHVQAAGHTAIARVGCCHGGDEVSLGEDRRNLETPQVHKVLHNETGLDAETVPRMRTEPLLPLTANSLRIAGDAAGSEAAALDHLFRQHEPRPSADASAAHPIRRIVSINDVHVSAGRNPTTHRIDPLDQFLPEQEQQFLRFMMREWLKAAGATASEEAIHRFGDLPWQELPKIESIRSLLRHRPEASHQLTLNLNGDILDFLQTTADSAGVRYPDGVLPGLRAPRNTPANAIVQLNVMRRGHPEFFLALALHLGLGHNIDFIPGNHDRALFNPLVWSGQLRIEGKELHGFAGIVQDDILRLGFSQADTQKALVRLRRLPLTMYGDAYFDHGDHSDADNRPRRPWKELYQPSAMHQEMQGALGDHGVQLGAQDLIAYRPTFAERWNQPAGLLDVAHAPGLAARMAFGYLKATLRDGYQDSEADDLDRRIEDARALPGLIPDMVEGINAFRNSDKQLTVEAIAEALASIEAASATPFFSKVPVNAGIGRRTLGIMTRSLLGRSPSHEEKWGQRVSEIHARLGANAIFQGHTHAAEDRTFVNEEGDAIRTLNAHTWTNQQGSFSQAAVRTWSGSSRGVGVVEVGRTAEGNFWTHHELMRVCDLTGRLNAGFFDEIDQRPSEKRRARRFLERIFRREPQSMASQIGLACAFSPPFSHGAHRCEPPRYPHRAVRR